MLCVCMLDREGRVNKLVFYAQGKGEHWVFSSTAIVLYNIYIVVVWTAVCVTSYSDYLTGFREPLSRTYRCHTGLKNV